MIISGGLDKLDVKNENAVSLKYGLRMVLNISFKNENLRCKIFLKYILSLFKCCLIFKICKIFSTITALLHFALINIQTGKFQFLVGTAMKIFLWAPPLVC